MIEIVDYDQVWPARFREEAKLLRRVLEPVEIRVEHVGSTSVEGLKSKPIVDIAVELKDWEQVEALRERLERCGYLRGEAAPGRERMFFTKTGDDGRRLVHLHLSSQASTSMRELLVFRDALRADPVLAAEYQMLKHKLSKLYPNDLEAYTHAKSDFIKSVLRENG